MFLKREKARPPARTRPAPRRERLAGAAAAPLVLALCAAGAGGSAAPVVAAAAAVEEMVVTARKREERLADVPVAVTALTAADLARRNADDLFAVGNHAPNLFIGNYGNGNQNHVSVFMRGVGVQDHIITVDSAVALYLDGVYLGRQVGANLGLANIERVEAARGPQGVLYGRNAIGGAINVITKKPGAAPAATLTLQGGSRGRGRFDFYGAAPLSETLAASVAGFYNRRNGVGEFINQPHTEVEVGQVREAGGRIMFDFAPSADFSLLLAADLADAAHGQSPTHFNAAPGKFPNDLPGRLFAADPDDNASPHEHVARQTSRAYGFSATATHRLGEDLSLKAIGSYRFSEYRGGLDQQDSAGSVVFPEWGEAEQFSAELQLAGGFGAWDFVAGAYYFAESGRTVSAPFKTLGGVAGELNISQETDSMALFASVDYAVTDALSLGGGARITRDEKDAAGAAATAPPAVPVPRQADWTEATWELSATYALTEEVNAYLAASRGYQSGGFPARPFGGADAFTAFDPQFAMNYEAGVKGVFLDQWRLAAALFWTEYTDLQLQTNRFNARAGAGFLTITENAGASRARGAELEGLWRLADYFSVQFAVGYLDAEFTKVGPGVAGTREGAVPQLAPKWTVSVAPELRLPLGGGIVACSLNYHYRSALYGEADNNPLNRIAARDLLGFNVRYQPDNGAWSVAVYGENVFNKVYDTASGAFGNPFALTIRNNDRSEFGIRFTRRFGAG